MSRRKVEVGRRKVKGRRKGEGGRKEDKSFLPPSYFALPAFFQSFSKKSLPLSSVMIKAGKSFTVIK